MPASVVERRSLAEDPAHPKHNWVTDGGGLPKYLSFIAGQLHKDGKPAGQAIAIALGALKKWSAGQGKVSKVTRARATQALAEWEVLRAKAAASKAKAAAGGKDMEAAVTGADGKATGTADSEVADDPDADEVEPTDSELIDSLDPDALEAEFAALLEAGDPDDPDGADDTGVPGTPTASDDADQVNEHEPDTQTSETTDTNQTSDEETTVDVDAKSLAESLPVEVKSLWPYLPGSVEERLEQIRSEVSDLLMPDPVVQPDGTTKRADAYVSIDATFAGYVVATLADYSGDGPTDRQTFIVPWSLATDTSSDDDGDSMITLGTPEPAHTVTVVVSDADGVQADDTEVAQALAAAGKALVVAAERAVTELTATESTTAMGGKDAAKPAVHSTHARHLRSAYDHLVGAMRGLGVPVPVSTPPDATTTSTDPLVTGGKQLTEAEIAAESDRLLAEAKAELAAL